ncbi:MAG: hypothetical protein ACYCSF_00610 [Acidimicrobiales bacterium]
MPTISAHGIRLGLMSGMEGRIIRRIPPQGAVAYPVVQAASFPIPPRTGDFGTGAVEAMKPDDVFLTLVEVGREHAGSALYRHPRLPRALLESEFSERRMKRPLPGQCGGQWFFTENGRPFNLYVVLGSFVLRRRLVPAVNEILRRVTIEESL